MPRALVDERHGVRVAAEEAGYRKGDPADAMDLVRDRANRSLEHVFTVLALTLPSRPLQLAFRGLHTDDPHLRGTALEYLEATLPDDVRRALWPFLEDTRTERGPARSAREVLDDLLTSHASIALNLGQLRRRPGS